MVTDSSSRSPDYLYVLCSNAAYGWRTGHFADGRQIISGFHTAIFSSDGDLLAHERNDQKLAFVEAPIRVKRFALQVFRLGIIDLPDTMREFLAGSGDGSWGVEELHNYPDAIKEWLDLGQYVFYFDGASYYMNREGHVETS